VTILAFIALFGWIPLVVVLFAMMPSRQAATVAVIGAWLILPPYTIPIAGLPDYSKITAASIGMLLATAFLAPHRLLTFRPRWYDLPMLGFCFCGVASSLQNGLGLYDGLSDSLTVILTWGLPYLLGRIYFGTPEDLRYFTVAVVVGGLCYVLPCFYEVRMSPQLLKTFYGFSAWGSLRLGGYRPQVFFWTGLECGLWMTAATLSGWWLWRCGALRSIRGIPCGLVILPILFVTSFFCRASGAMALLAGGMGVLWLTARYRTRLLLAGLLLVAPVYAGVRLTNLWTGQQAVDISEAVFGAERAESLGYRFMCENLLAAKALEQPVFGWSGWGRSAAYFNPDLPWRTQVPTDGMWIIFLGTKGFVGLTLFYLALILPAILFVRRFPAPLWMDPRLAAGSLAATFLGLYMIDCLMNGFVNIIYVTMAGGLISLEPGQLRALAAPRRGIEAAGRRAATTATGIPGAGPHSGRLALADRYRTLGRSSKQAGRPDEAEAAWRHALEVLDALLRAAPDAADLRRRWCDCANDLAWLRANHPDPARRDPISAVAMARRAVDECPDAAAYWNTLGVAYYRAGDPHAAVAALDRARALGGGTAFDDVFLAMARARLGDAERAGRDLARAMLQAERDYPGHPELAGFCDEARDLLAGGAPAAAR
jgi:tetratricopeptide (TPR) repeat protein